MERSYLEQLAGIETPKIRRGMSNNLYEEVCGDYFDLRNFAKDLLINPGNKKDIIKLSELIKKLRLEEASKLN